MTCGADKPVPTLEDILTLPPEQRLAALREAGEVARRIVELGEQAEKLAFSEVGRALEVTSAVVDLADQIGTPRGRARARRARAQALAYAGQHAEALETCRAAMRIAESAGEWVEAARARVASMHPLGELGRYDEAIAAGLQAHKMLREAGEPALAARADINLGGIYQNRDDPERALFHLKRAAEALAEEPELLGYVENNRGEALLLLNRFDEAEQAFTAARDACERARADLIAAIAEGNLADLAARRGRLHEALEHFERARMRLEANQAGSHLARLLAEQAEAFETLGLTSDALATYERALPQLERHGLTWDAARARTGIAQCLLRQDRLDRAGELLDEAARAFEQLGHAAARARVQLLQAEVAIRQGRLDEARTLLDAARGPLAKRPLDDAVHAYHEARLALACNDADAAERALRRGIGRIEPLDLAPLMADLKHARGLVHRLRGEPAEAEQALRDAIEQIERARGALQAERFRAAFLGERLGAYEDLVLALLDQDAERRLPDALRTIEQARSRSLLDVIGGALALDAAVEASDPRQAQLAEQARALRGALNALYSRLSETPATGAQAEHWRTAIAERETQLRAVENRLLSTHAAVRYYVPPVGLETLQAELGPGDVVAEYFLARDELIAVVVQHNAAAVFRRLADRATVTDAVQRLVFQLHRAMRPGATHGPRGQRLLADTHKALERLHALLIKPFASILTDAATLHVIPYGPLHVVPFHALYDGEHYVLDHCATRYGLSASLLVHLAEARRARPPCNVRAPLVVGVADALAPRIESEARAVREVLGEADLLLGPQASVWRVRESVIGRPLLHLACHARFSTRNPLGSGLKLADGLLTVRELYGLPLNAELVTLSGCNTGRNVVHAGDELLGLTRVFLAAGARMLMASLWPAHDELSTELMQRFYSLWRPAPSCDASRPCDALRTAQQQLRHEHPHPTFWAPFILIG